MAKASINPFRPTRWEHHSDGLPLIWFPSTGELLAGDKSAFVYGSRGSGKTSLLRSICWEDLVRNPSLMLQRTLADSRHIGIYIRLPDHVAASLGFLHWDDLFPGSQQPEWEFFRFFSLAIELICIEKALTAAHELRLSGHLQLEASQELRLVSETLEEFPHLPSFGDQPPNTFSSLSRLCRTIVRRMNEASGRGTLGQIVDLLPAREPYDLLNFCIGRLSGIARLKSSDGGISPAFKFCLDDCEVLNVLQRNSINTLVRKSRFPVSWVVCSVGEVVDTGDTFLPQQPLTDADRRVISLNDRARPDFAELCQAVASLRTYFSISELSRPRATSETIRDFFSLQDRLGYQDVNDTFAIIVGRSTSPLAKGLRRAAVSLRDRLWKVDRRFRTKYPARSQKFPYYEAYVLRHWTGREDQFMSHENDDVEHMLALADRLRQPNIQAWMRRKMVGALLHFVSRLGTRRLPLAGWNIVVTLADGSIRDFLEIMAEIYDKYDVGKTSDEEQLAVHERFALSRTKIAASSQNAGIHAASESFFNGISAQTDANPEAIERLIEALGRFTSVLQTNADDPTTLATTERGVFVIEPIQGQLIQDSTSINNTYATLLRAELAGYLRTHLVRRRTGEPIVGTSPPNKRAGVGYRLHRRFAPYFRYSYRGAYEPVRLDIEHLAPLCHLENAQSVEQWLKPLTARGFSVADKQLMLALRPEDDE
jgi:hypothetical protein